MADVAGHGGFVRQCLLHLQHPGEVSQRGCAIGFLRPDGAYEKPRPTEHLRIPPGLPIERDGRLSLRMTEEMRELTALDSVRLVAVDHLAGVEVYSNERLREVEEPFRYVVLADLRPPEAMAVAANCLAVLIE